MQNPGRESRDGKAGSHCTRMQRPHSCPGLCSPCGGDHAFCPQGLVSQPVSRFSKKGTRQPQRLGRWNLRSDLRRDEHGEVRLESSGRMGMLRVREKIRVASSQAEAGLPIRCLQPQITGSTLSRCEGLHASLRWAGRSSGQ